MKFLPGKIYSFKKKFRQKEDAAARRLSFERVVPGHGVTLFLFHWERSGSRESFTDWQLEDHVIERAV